MSQALAELRVLLTQLEPGFGMVTTCPTQEGRVAEALAEGLPGAVVVGPDEVAGVGRADVVLVAGLPVPDALELWNGRRDLASSQGLRVVLVVDRRGAEAVRRHAPDVADALTVDELAPYLPEEVDEEEALAEYRTWLRQRYGRLDLRGFARSEREDVSWEVGEVFVPLTAAGDYWLPAPRPGRWGPRPSRPQRELHFYRDRNQVLDGLGGANPRVRVLLGHPGSGKTFFLRWLALSEGVRQLVYGDAAALPVLAPLSTYARQDLGRSLSDHLRDQLLAAGLRAGHLVECLAAQGRACFLLDGLDEGGDAGVRKALAEALRSLSRRYPRCPVLVTSRITGFDPVALPAAPLELRPFDDAQVRTFLGRWMGLYAAQRLGDSTSAREAGAAEGLALADDVLSHPQLANLARSPLLLTVLATVHRAGLRLPDHRVELYEHATRILVERWNRVRGLASDGRAPPIKAADAVRMLGPVALRSVERGPSATIDERELLQALDRALADGRLRSVADPADALRIFKEHLGLLVEQGPGVWSFLHLTLAEYYAAWELVRTRRIERLARDPVAAFQARYREVLLLAAGTLGILRADDPGLASLADSLVQSARRRPGRPSTVVPSLLAGLLADDPGLSAVSAQALVDELVPTWWFQRAYGRTRYEAVARQAATDLGPRILAGPHGPALRARLRQSLVDAPSDRQLSILGRAGAPVFTLVLALLRAARLDATPLLLAALARPGPEREAARLAWSLEGRIDGERLVLRVPAALDAALRAAEPALALVVRLQERIGPTDRGLVLTRKKQLHRRDFVQIGTDGPDLLLAHPTPPPHPDRTLLDGPIDARPKLPPKPDSRLPKPEARSPKPAAKRPEKPAAKRP